MRTRWWGGRTSGPRQEGRPGLCRMAPFLASPLCWRRTELALLARCNLGTPVLQKVAVKTMQLALELGALMDVGLL